MKSTTYYVHPFAKKKLPCACRARKIYMDDTVLLHYNYARTLSLHIVYKTYRYIHVYALHVARVHVHVDLHVSLQKAGLLLLHFAILQIICRSAGTDAGQSALPAGSPGSRSQIADFRRCHLPLIDRITVRARVAKEENHGRIEAHVPGGEEEDHPLHLPQDQAVSSVLFSDYRKVRPDRRFFSLMAEK